MDEDCLWRCIEHSLFAGEELRNSRPFLQRSNEARVLKDEGDAVSLRGSAAAIRKLFEKEVASKRAIRSRSPSPFPAIFPCSTPLEDRARRSV
jgi:hypothetical protein